MLSALNLSRLAALAGTVGSALVIFVSAAAPNGKYTAAGVFAGLVAVWVHEEHSTERNATTAAASLKPAPAPVAPAVAVPSVHEVLGALGVGPVLTASGQSVPVASQAPAAAAVAPPAPSAP